MNLFFKNIFHMLSIAILMVPFLIHSMEPTTRPTIKTKVYFNPDKPAFYATDEQIQYLNTKGIPTPANPVVREVIKAEVIESDGSVTNWKQQPTKSIKMYEESLTQEPLTFEQKRQQAKAIQEKTFPKYLPVESSFNCTNGSKMSRTIAQFPTEITFESENVFHEEQNQCMVQFFTNQNLSYQSQQDLRKHIQAHRLDERIIHLPALRLRNTRTNQPTFLIQELPEYSHGKNGCPDISVFVQRMAGQNINLKQTSVHKHVFNRQINGK